MLRGLITLTHSEIQNLVEKAAQTEQSAELVCQKLQHAHSLNEHTSKIEISEEDAEILLDFLPKPEAGVSSIENTIRSKILVFLGEIRNQNPHHTFSFGRWLKSFLP